VSGNAIDSEHHLNALTYMSITTADAALARSHHDGQSELPQKAESAANYKGFVAGVFSGMAKLTGIDHSV
jgi:hypothetical protein